MAKHLLEVKNLRTSFNIPAGEVRSVNGISLTLDKGKVLGIVGESGSGKSVTAYSIMQILESPGRVVAGQILFNGKDMLNIPHHQLQKIRGEKISIIFQDAMTSLNPVWSIGNQLREMVKKHPNAPVYKASRNAMLEAKKRLILAKKYKHPNKKIIELTRDYKAKKKIYENYPQHRALEMLKLVGINEPEKRLKQYPFEFSGGMLQRIMIAMALSNEPELLIADEPTTALDVTIQAQILELLKNIQKKMGMAVIIITHDLGVVAQICDYVNVMYAGRIVEKGTVRDIFYNPKHEYTKGLMNSIPRANVKADHLTPIKGNPVDVFCLPKGCSFSPRCDKCMKVCLSKYPNFMKVDKEHETACFAFVLEQLKKKKITKKEFDAYLASCQTGNKAFKPITRIDVQRALTTYTFKKNECKANIIDEKLSKEEKEVMLYRVQDAKKEYYRARKDFRLAQKNFRNSRSEKKSINHNDVRKKTRHYVKKLRAIVNSMNDTKFKAFLDEIKIATTAPNENVNKEVVKDAKTIMKRYKRFLFKRSQSREERINHLSKYDDAKITYITLKDDLKWLKYVNKHLARLKKYLTFIYNRAKKKKGR